MLHTKPLLLFKYNWFHFLIILSILFLSYSIVFAEHAVITPDKVTSNANHTFAWGFFPANWENDYILP